jgi:RND family efflux transporter MFP subunit
LLALVACNTAQNEEQSIEKLKSKRAELEQQLTELNTQIKTIEKAAGKVEVQMKTVYVQVTELKPALFQHYLEMQGKVASDNNVTITPKTAGQIIKINVLKGQAVQKGALLASIDVAALVKGRDELKTGLDFATNLYEKQKALWEQKVGTEVQYLQAKNNKESLEGKLATLNEQISYGSVVAPASGEIEEVYPKEGESISPGMPMFRLVGNGDFKIVADVSEAYSAHVNEGNEAEVYFPNLEKTVKTTVKVVGDEIDATNRTFDIELRLPQKPSGVKANMIAYVKVKDYEAKNVLSVPVSVIQKSPEGNFVFVDKDGKAAKQVVKIGETYKGLTEVKSGLQAGQKLITAGYLDLIEGQPVVSTK